MATIHYAAYCGHIRIVEILVQARASVNCEDNIGKQPIHYAAAQGHTGIIELLLQACVSVNTIISSKKETPLTLAATRGHTQTVEFLLSKGADVEMETVFGDRALHCAARAGHVDVVAALIHAGASIDSRNNEMQTPLLYYLYFVRRCKIEMLKTLLGAGADLRLTYKTSNHNTLDMAIDRSSCSAEVMTFLYAAGASICPDVLSRYRNIIPKFIIDDQEPMVDLLGLCRRKIRAVLLSPAWGNQKYLSSAIVAQLPLPERLKKELTFGVDI